MVPNKYNKISYEIFLIINLFGDINADITFYIKLVKVKKSLIHSKPKITFFLDRWSMPSLALKRG
jgi:hypothetical protein